MTYESNPPPRGGDEGGQVGGGGDMHNSDTEHDRAICCDAVDSGSLLGGKATAGGMSIKSKVGAGGYKPGWDMESNGDGSRYVGGG